MPEIRKKEDKVIHPKEHSLLDEPVEIVQSIIVRYIIDTQLSLPDKAALARTDTIFRSMIQPTLRASKLLKHIAFNERSALERMLEERVRKRKSNLRLLLIEGQVKDRSGHTFTRITPLQFILQSQKHNLIPIIRKYLSADEEGELDIKIMLEEGKECSNSNDNHNPDPAGEGKECSNSNDNHNPDLAIDPKKINFKKLRYDGVLGKGSTATVYKATWQDITIAIKQIRYKATHRAHRLEILCEQEVNFMQTLKELKTPVPYVVTLLDYTYSLDYAQCKSYYYLALSYMNVGSLFSYMDNKANPRFDWGTTLRLMKNIAAALQGLHENKLVHCDVKRDNVFLKNENGIFVAYLGDFGFSKSLETEAAKEMIASGTPLYMAPEVITKTLPHSTKTDIFSYGGLLWETGAWEALYTNFNELGAFREFIASGKRAAIPDRFPSKYAQFIKRCWEHLPEKRPTAQEIMQGMDELLLEKSAKPNI